MDESKCKIDFYIKWIQFKKFIIDLILENNG